MSYINVASRIYVLGYKRISKWNSEASYNDKKRREILKDQKINPENYQTTSPALVTRDYTCSFMKK